jgi:chorismate mutase/prephenate dehydratase
MFTLPHQSGALSNLLSVFANSDINLLKIESRPSNSGSFEYIFFVDFEGSLTDPKVVDVLSVLNTMSASLKIIGNYNVI